MKSRKRIDGVSQSRNPELFGSTKGASGELAIWSCKESQSYVLKAASGWESMLTFGGGGNRVSEARTGRISYVYSK